MAEKERESAIRNFIGALEKKDVQAALAFFTDDATWMTNEGTFRGKEEIREYVQWTLDSLDDLTFAEDGIGILVEGDKAVYQHVYEGTYQGNRIKTYGVCTYQFEGNRCKTHFTASDRLSTARQAAKGLFARRAVAAIVNIMEKGLG